MFSPLKAVVASNLRAGIKANKVGTQPCSIKFEVFTEREEKRMKMIKKVACTHCTPWGFCMSEASQSLGSPSSYPDDQRNIGEPLDSLNEQLWLRSVFVHHKVSRVDDLQPAWPLGGRRAWVWCCWASPDQCEMQTDCIFHCPVRVRWGLQSSMEWSTQWAVLPAAAPASQHCLLQAGVAAVM